MADDLEIEAARKLSETDRALVEIFCSRLSIAFDNVILYEQLQAANTRLEERVAQRTQDLTAANRAIQDLRRLGHLVCLDDFGAGAASLDYLRQLEVDFIKFDGRYIRTLAAGSRMTGRARWLSASVLPCPGKCLATVARLPS